MGNTGFLRFEYPPQLVAGSFNAKRTLRDESGFALVELLVVVAIIALLVSVALPQLSVYRTKANNGVCEADIRSLATALEIYYVDNSTYATATLVSLAGDYSFIQTQIGGGNACNLQITNQTGVGWTATSQWADGVAGDGTMVYTRNSLGGGGLQPPAPL